MFTGRYDDISELKPSLTVKVFEGLLDAKIVHKKRAGLFYYKALVLQGRIACAVKVSKMFDCEGKAPWLHEASLYARHVSKTFRGANALLHQNEFMEAAKTFLAYREGGYEDKGCLDAMACVCVATCLKRAGLFRQAAEVSRRAIDGFPTFILALYQLILVQGTVWY